MKKVTVIVVGIMILLIGSLVGNVVLYDFWHQEKAAHMKANTQLQQVKTKLRAANENSPVQLKKVAEDFARTLFSFEKSNQSERKKRLIELTSPKFGKELFDKNKNVNSEPISTKNSLITSQAKVKESIYNQTGPDTAKVKVTIEQSLQTDYMEDKTVQEIQVDLSYNGNKWKVVKFTAKPVL